MIIIALSGESIKISKCDYSHAIKYKWSIGSNGYPKRQFRENGKVKCQYLHRFIMNASSNQHVDHANGDKLDATRENLRLCTRHQNIQNQKLSTRNTSGFKGVSLDKRTYLSKRWCAEIAAFGQRVRLGRFETAEQAALAYNKKATELHGAFARLNSI